MLKRLDWYVVRRLDGMLQGDYRSLFFGHGLDLAEVREYQPEDDVRYMDWNVTARMGEPYVRQYMEDREITAWLLLDLSGSIDFGTALMRKRDLVHDFAAVLARLLTRHGNRVGAILFSGQIDEVVPPRGGALQALRLIHQISRPDRRSTPGATNLAEVLDQAGKTLRRRSLVFVVSDFISAPGWEQSLSRLARRHEVVAVWVRDPREEEIPDIGPVVMQDAETGEQIYVETQDRKFRDRFRALVEERRRHIERTFSRHGIDALLLSTEGDLVRDLGRFVLLRRQSRQRQGAGYLRAAGVAS
ncbi:MAG TPA: DUF58 domain-containing protein [Dehalococcoidia bacterium]|nr:DUF58 domain-containing protein [Dehalococcoidia bacterium]